ncbi:MAG: Ig-like domain-containing protein [Saprospiraceae bacterium]
MYIKHPLFYTLLLCLFCSDLSAQEIIRGPYLQLSTTSSIRIKWRTDFPTDSKVWYGDYHDSLNEEVYDDELTTEHSVEITGLDPDTKYYYAVGTSAAQLDGESDDHYFKTHPEEDSTPEINIWVLGDAGSKDNYQRETRDAYYNWNGDDHIDMMLLLGDNAYEDGTDSEYQYGWFEDMYEDRLINSVMWSAYGNHDAGSADSETETGVYFDIFDFPRDGECGGEPSGTEAYYSFDYGNIHLISLNSHDGDAVEGGEMIEWLENDLEDTDKDWIVAFFHHPPYTGYNGNNSDNNTKEKLMRQNVVPLLEDAGVDLVVYGHSHVYQRSFLINGHYDISATFDPETMALDIGDGKTDGDSPYVKAIGGPDDGRGTVYISTGAAGPLSTNHILDHPVMYYNNSAENGSLGLKVDGLELNGYYIDIEGNIDDHFTIVKQVEPPVITMLNPQNGTYYENIETISISADASDSDGTVEQVAFYINNELISTDFDAPYSTTWIATELGGYRVKCIATDNDGNIKSAISNIQIGPISFCEEVVGTTNDAEETQFGEVSLGSSDLEIGYDNSYQTVAVRFPDLRIPRNATINNAYLQFTAEAPSNINPANFKIYCEDNDDSESLIGEDYNLSTRPKTEAVVNWSPPNWNSYGDDGVAQRTPDLAALIQEVVFRPGYAPKSGISFLLDGVGRRRAISENGDPEKGPVLCIEYNPFCADSDNDGTCDLVDQCPDGLEPGTICDDGDPDTFDDAINEDCICAGKVYDCNEESAYFGDPCDDNNPNTYNDAWNTNCECEGVYATMTYACSSIEATADDAEEDESGDVRLDSGDLEMVNDNDNQVIGLRFSDLEIPFGAIIQHADIQFTTDGTDNINPTLLKIYGEATANPLSFEEEDYNISGRPKTVAVIDWTPADWRKKGKSEKEERTINIAPVIQEAVNRWGFTDTSSIVIIIEGIGKRTAESFDGEPEESPRLCVDYAIDSPPGGGFGAQTEEGDKNLSSSNTDKDLNQSSRAEPLKVFPNPTKQEVHVTFRNSSTERIPLIIRDMSGRVVFQKDIFAQAGNNHFLIPNLDVENGVYVVSVLLDGIWSLERLVVLGK